MAYLKTKDGRIVDLKDWTRSELTAINADTGERSYDILYSRTYMIYHGDEVQIMNEQLSCYKDSMGISTDIEILLDRIILSSRRKCFVLTKAEYYKFKKKEGKEIYGAVWDRTSKVPVLKSVAIKKEGKWELV